MIKFRHLGIVFVLAIVVGCRPIGSIAESATTNVWKSDHFNVSVELPNGWRTTHMNTPGDTHDRPDQTIAAFLNKPELCLYIVRIEPDAPLDQLSLDAYVTVVKAQFESQAGYAYLDNDQINLHDSAFERLRFRIEGDGKTSVMHVCIHRDGKHLVTIQMSHPSQGEDTKEIPLVLAKFDSGVRLNLQDLSRTGE